MASAFHLIALPIGSEEAVLAAAEAAILEVDPGETVFFSEALAWTASGSGIAYMRMVKQARTRDVNLVATLNMGGELAEDLPGRKEGCRYHAVVVFTRHGHVHVPQAKVFPLAAEMRAGATEEALPVAAYTRSNLVRLDMDEQVIEVRFLVGADLAFLADHPPTELACDVLIVQSRVPPRAEEKLRASLEDARSAGVASTTLEINGHGNDGRGEPISVKVEEAADAGKAMKPKTRWPSTTRLPRRFYRYTPRRRGDIEAVTELERLARDPKRDGRIPLLRPLRAPKIELGIYPVIIVL